MLMSLINSYHGNMISGAAPFICSIFRPHVTSLYIATMRGPRVSLIPYQSQWSRSVVLSSL